MLLEQEFIYLEATNNEMFVGERKDWQSTIDQKNNDKLLRVGYKGKVDKGYYYGNLTKGTGGCFIEHGNKTGCNFNVSYFKHITKEEYER